MKADRDSPARDITTYFDLSVVAQLVEHWKKEILSGVLTAGY